MKYTLKCKDSACISHVCGRVNLLPFQEFAAGTCLLAGFSWAMPDSLELTIDHNANGYDEKHPKQSFHVLNGAVRKKVGRPPKDGAKDV